MKRTTSEKFDLVPSLRPHSEVAMSPSNFIATIPVILSESPAVKTLALVEPGLAVCCIHEELFERLAVRPSILKNEYRLKVSGHDLRCDLAKLDLTLGDNEFFPWVRFSDLPVAVIGSKRWPFESVKFALGYEDCMQHFTLTFAFRHSYLRAETSSKFDVAKDGQEFMEPSRLIEAEKLFRSGAFESSIAMAASALEERLSQSFGNKRMEPMRFWVGSPDLKGTLSPEIGKKILRISQLRNQAVHHISNSGTSRNEARDVIRDTRAILRQIWIRQVSPDQAG